MEKTKSIQLFWANHAIFDYTLGCTVNASNAMSKDIHAIRKDYASSELVEDVLGDDPIHLFANWFEEARTPMGYDVNAMTLATVDRNGFPTTRIVLLKGIEQGNFLFYTNYTSKKSSDISENPYVSLCFFWGPLERQVRINGRAQKLSKTDSEAYFKTRPYESQIGAWASEQSAVIHSRAELKQKYDELCRKYPTVESVPFPEFWGGYKVSPNAIEFWQGRPGRLHDRIQYTREHDTWKWVRLSP
jgi:pyridoxamine 5'-phosphate oxidase